MAKKVSDSILFRVYILFGLFVLFGIVIVLRVFALQVNHDRWVKKEIEEQVIFKKVVADRGNILSEKGAIMAASLPFYKIGLDPTLIDTTQIESFTDSVMELSIKLAHKFDWENKDTMLYYNKIKKALAMHDRHVYLTRKTLDHKTLQQVKTWPILNMGRYKGGFIIEKIHNKRYYPYGDLAKITLGRIVNDTLGIRGIEHSYNSELRGRDGFMLMQKIAGDHYIPLAQYGEEPSDDGLDVQTTLDVDLQDIVERALERGVEKHKAKFGTAILMEVSTGKIKAIANYPEYYNYGVARSVEPGSTMKLAAALAAMEEGIISPGDTVDTGDGVIQYDDKEIKDGAAYGRISFEQCFAKSSNVCLSKVIHEGFGDTPNKYHQYLDRFGLTEPVNEQLKGEPNPVVIRPGDKHWNITTLPSMAIGYSMKVTPLQMAAFYNAVANEGVWMRPWIVKEVRDNAKVLASYGPEAAQTRICADSTIDDVRQLLTAVVDYGTAKNIKGTPFKIAGKTGTARKSIKGKYRNLHQASFGGYFPADNPSYTLYVMVDEPSNGAISGAKVAAPIFKEIAEQVYKMDLRLSESIVKRTERPNKIPAPKAISSSSAKEIYPALNISSSGIPDGDWLKTNSNGHQVNFQAMALKENRVPDVRGMSARDAINLLERSGLQVRVRGNGRVKRQSLQAGYIIGKRRNTVTIFLG